MVLDKKCNALIEISSWVEVLSDELDCLQECFELELALNLRRFNSSFTVVSWMVYQNFFGKRFGEGAWKFLWLMSVKRLSEPGTNILAI